MVDIRLKMVFDHLTFRCWISSRYGDIRDQIRKLCKIAPKFCMFLAPIFWGEGPRIFGLVL